MTMSLSLNTKHATGKQDPKNEDVSLISFRSCATSRPCLQLLLCVTTRVNPSDVTARSIKESFADNRAKKANSQRQLSTCSSILPLTVPYLFWCTLKLITDEYLPGYRVFFNGLVLYENLTATAVFLQSGLL